MWDDYYSEAYKATVDDANQAALEDAGYSSQAEVAAARAAWVAEATATAAHLSGVKVWDAGDEGVPF